MKNGIIFILCALLFVPTIYAGEGINTYEYGYPIIVSDTVQGEDGLPCLTCICNITIYAQDSSRINFSSIMTNNGNGIYEAIIPKLEINTNDSTYPVIIYCSSGTYYGTSSIKGLKIMSTMNFTPFAIILIAITSLFAFISFKLEGNTENKVWMKWAFLGLTFIMLIVDSILGFVISPSSGINGLQSFFEAMIWFSGIVFILFLYFFLNQMIFDKNANEE